MRGFCDPFRAETTARFDIDKICRRNAVFFEMRIVERQLAIPAQDECFGRHGMQEHYLAYVVHEKCDAKSSAIRHKPIKELCCALQPILVALCFLV